ncbi:MAG: YafY family transcriptional regulator [bacterium]|nr:YafY family transcriptional regulator [bacterium]
MKIDRLLGILIYLLNRKSASARELAELFEVSVRTIQRDIDSLCMAGIPVYATQGASGGYSIMDAYTLDKQIINPDDFFFIITALKGLCSAYDNKKVFTTLEKIKSLFSRNSEDDIADKLYIDFTAFKESKNMKENFSFIEEGIEHSKLLEFDYTGSNHRHSHRTVEPLTIAFKWHSWYLLAYCREKSDYRLFSISRIRNIKLLNKTFKRKSINPEEFFNQNGENSEEHEISLKLKFDADIRVAMEVNFSGGTITELDNKTCLLEINLPKNEQYWLGMIMSFGNKIKILEPPVLKEMILEKTGEIMALYQSK